MIKFLKTHFWFLILTICYFIFCLLTYKQFGITDDEFVEYRAGKSLLYFYQTGQEKNFNLSDTHLPTNALYFRVHLAFYNLLNPNFYYEIFHLQNLFFAYFLLVTVYFLFYKHYQNQHLALIPVLTVLLTPRVFGDFAGNPKDIPFAIFFVFSLCLMYFLQRKYSLYLQILLAISIGFAASIRLLGLSLLIINFIYFYLHADRKGLVFQFKSLIFLILGVLLVQFISLPYLWSDTLKNFLNLILQSSSFSLWNNTNLYYGELVGKGLRTRGYLFVWIGISTPIFILGLYLWSLTSIRNIKENKLLVLLNISIFTNLLLYLLINPVIYNGPRHFIFVLLLMSLGAATFLIDLLKKLPILQVKILLIIYGVFALSILNFYYKFHPYYYLYFNEFIGQKNAQGQFDYDYWGETYKEMTLILVEESDKSQGKFNVYPCSQAFGVTYFSKNKFKVVSKLTEADFTICDFDSDRKEKLISPIFREIKRDGVSLGIIRKIK